MGIIGLMATSGVLSGVVGGTVNEVLWQVLEGRAAYLNQIYNRAMSELLTAYRTTHHPENNLTLDNVDWSQRNIYHIPFSGEQKPAAGDICELYSKHNDQIRQYRVPGHEAKWLGIAVIIGVASAILSMYVLVPVGATLALKVSIGVAAGIAGFMGAASRTLARVNDACVGH